MNGASSCRQVIECHGAPSQKKHFCRRVEPWDFGRLMGADREWVQCQKGGEPLDLNRRRGLRTGGRMAHGLYQKDCLVSQPNQ